MKNKLFEPYEAPECTVVPILSEGVVCNSFDPTDIEDFDEIPYEF